MDEKEERERARGGEGPKGRKKEEGRRKEKGCIFVFVFVFIFVIAFRSFFVVLQSFASCYAYAVPCYAVGLLFFFVRQSAWVLFSSSCWSSILPRHASLEGVLCRAMAVAFLVFVFVAASCWVD